MADVTADVAARLPTGTANPVGACYMHVLHSEDRLINRPRFRDAQPLYTTTWAGRNGADPLEPDSGGGDIGDWYRSVRIDLAAAREYGKAVYAMSEEWVGSLTDDQVSAELDLGPFGRHSLAYWIGFFLVTHCSHLTGEISAVKGTFGLKGYPF